MKNKAESLYRQLKRDGIGEDAADAALHAFWMGFVEVKCGAGSTMALGLAHEEDTPQAAGNPDETRDLENDRIGIDIGYYVRHYVSGSLHHKLDVVYNMVIYRLNYNLLKCVHSYDYC